MSYDHDQQRDYAEEAYLRNFCPECDGTCTSPDGHADLDAPNEETPVNAVIHRRGYAPENIDATAAEDYALENAHMLSSDHIEETEIDGIVYLHRVRWFGDTLLVVRIN